MKTKLPSEQPTQVSPTSFSVFFLFQIWLGEGSIHHLPVARPNEADVCQPNGTWAPSVTSKPKQRNAAFILPASVADREGITFDLSLCVCLFLHAVKSL